jgi:uncharacterized membrane protein
MDGELIVTVFKDASEADTVLEALRVMRRSKILALEHVVVVNKDRTGKLRMREEWESEAPPSDGTRKLLGSLANLIFTAPFGETTRRLIESGMDEDFFEEIASSLVDDSSALCFLVLPEGSGDADELFNALIHFRGTTYRTTLTSGVEAVLLQGSP